MAKATILVVDDSPDFRALIRFALERAGYAVFEADGGVAALALLDEAKPDLVLVDVEMPVMSGDQLVAQLRGRGTFEVIAMSGRIDAQSSPTRWFLSKPVEISLLLSVVGDFCGRKGTSPLWGPEPAVRKAPQRIAG